MLSSNRYTNIVVLLYVNKLVGKPGNVIKVYSIHRGTLVTGVRDKLVTKQK